MRRIVGLLFLLLAPAAGFWMAPQSAVHVVIAHTNDIHGQLLAKNGVGGIAEMAAVIKGMKPDLIFDAGDISTGTFLSDEFQGRPTIDAMNEIGYTSGTVGNHEFDYGQDALRAILGRAKFPVLSANLDTPIKQIRKYITVTVDGIRFGVIGLTTESVKTTTDPRNLSGVEVRDIVETLQQLLPEVRRQSDFIIATVHLDDEEEKRIADAFPEIRLIIGGHNHAAFGPLQIGSTLIAKTGSIGRNVGRVQLEFVDRKLERMDAQLIPVRNVRPDPAVQKILEPYSAEVRAKMGEVIGEAAGDFTYSRNAESPLADIVADAFRWKTGTQIAIHNIGGIRAAISKGQITWGKVFEVLPFQDTMITLKLTGAQLKQLLEDRPGMLAVSGVRVQFDLSRPRGRRLVSAVLLDGSPVEDSKLYSVATNDFLLAGGDGVVELAKGKDIVDTGFAAREALVEYVKDRRVVAPRVDGRLQIR